MKMNNSGIKLFSCITLIKYINLNVIVIYYQNNINVLIFLLNLLYLPLLPYYYTNV